MDYETFVKQKRRVEVATGHSPSDLNEHLFDFQHAIVTWAVRRGRAAIFADTGLGKTLMQLSWADEVASHTGGIVLILAPLAVSEQTIEQGSTFGIDVRRVPNGGTPDSPGVWITNYERMDHIDFESLHGLVLDESSILKSHDGKTRQRIINAAQRIPYRLSCTATPSPNDFEELGNQCEFLGVMTRTEMLATYFVNDTGDTGTWILKGGGSLDSGSGWVHGLLYCAILQTLALMDLGTSCQRQNTSSMLSKLSNLETCLQSLPKRLQNVERRSETASRLDARPLQM